MKKLIIMLMALVMMLNVFGCAVRFDNNGMQAWGVPAKDGMIYTDEGKMPVDPPWGLEAQSPSYVIRGHLNAGATFKAGLDIVSGAMSEVIKLPIIAILFPG